VEVAVALGLEPLDALQPRLLGVGEGRQLLGAHLPERDEPEGGGIDVHADDVVGVGSAHLRGDERAPVAALRPVAPVAEAAHQLDPGPGDPFGGPARLGGRSREAVAGDRRDHQVEGVGGVAAVRRRIGQRPDDLEELRDRARPAVGDDQGQRRGLRRADVQKVDAGAVDGGQELGEPVEPCLVGAPVVAVAPVAGQLLEVAERHPVRPAGAGQLIGPAGPGQAVPEVVERGVGDVAPEGLDLGHGTVGRGHGNGSSPGELVASGEI
jgi:hypothetical protein